MEMPRCMRCEKPMRHLATMPPIGGEEVRKITLVFCCDDCGGSVWRELPAQALPTDSSG